MGDAAPRDRIAALRCWRAEPDARSAAGLDEWEPDPERIGICCSGGGIRSAAYSLGALQRLQQAGVLQRAAYLSAVSGGSYIAAALTIARRSATDPFAHGTPEERYLRNRTNYLVPHGNEAVFLGYRMVLGIAINMVLVSLTLGLAAIACALLYEWADIAVTGELHVRRWALAGTAGVAAASLALGLFYLLVRLSRWGGRGRSRTNADGSPSGPELARLVLQTWVVRLFWLAVGLGAILVVVPALADWLRDPRGAVGDVAAPAIPAASLLTVVVALLTQLLSKPPKELIDQVGKVGRAAALRPKLIRALAGVAATVAVPLLALAWVVAVVAWTVGADAEAVAAAFAAGAAVLAFLLAKGDLTSWSLHPFYRARLASVFALRRDGDRARALGLHHIGLGRAHKGKPIKLLIADRDIHVLDAQTGDLIRQLTLDPSRDYQPIEKG